MLFRSPRLVASLCLATAASCFSAPNAAGAREAYRASEPVVREMAPISREDARDIIFEMAPLQPVKKSAVAAPEHAHPPQAKAEPTLAAKSAEAPKVEEVRAAESPKPVDLAKPHEQSDQPAQMALVPPKSEAVPQNMAPQTTAEPAFEAPAAPAQDQLAPVAPESAIPAPPLEVATPEAAPTVEPPLQAVPPPRDEALAPHTAESPIAPEIEAPLSPPAAENNNAASAENAAPHPAEAAPAPVESAPLNPAERVAALLAQGVKGPAEVRIADRATMWLPAGRSYLPAEPARELAKEAGLEWKPTTQGMIAPEGDSLRWLAPVDLLDDGYIKSDSAALDAEQLLAAFQAGLPEVNAQRANAGQPPVALAGWLSAPALDEKNRLSACVSIASQTGGSAPDRFFNCEAWALGRQGAVKIGLAEGGEQADRLKGEAIALAQTIVYDHDKAYGDANPETDKVAPYTAADLLTSDVSTKAAPVRPPVETGDAGGTLGPMAVVAKLWKAMLIALAAIACAFALWRRRGKPTPVGREAPRATPPTTAKQTALKPQTPASLFARLLPTLHAKFVRDVAKKNSVAAPVEAEQNATTEKPAPSGLLEKLTALRGKLKVAGLRPAPVGKAATPSIAEEPASVLKKLALRMRGHGIDEPAAPVNVARAVRPKPRTLPGAAPEPLEQAQPTAASPTPAPQEASSVAKEKAPEPQDDVFGLIEPGDEAATSAAINASEALRRASA